MNRTKNALLDFTQKYHEQWRKQFNHLPKSESLYGIVSPCIEETKDLAVFWQSVLFEAEQALQIVEKVMEITIISSAHVFYGTQYAGDMRATFDGRALNLIQIWSEEDFSRLEQNLIAHLSMQKKLKRRPTIFIASTDDDSEIISIDNQSGSIVLEKLIDNQVEVLAENLETFLSCLIPVAH